MKVLSLFDGISCARVALKKAGIPVEVYYASEIDKHALTIAQKNWPDTVQLGDITTIHHRFDMDETFAGGGIDLLIGGSPCQDLSRAKTDGQGLKGSRSSLFYDYLRILRNVKPKWFILENVASMKAVYRDEITKLLGVEPIMIDAALVSAQTRKRLFWTNIPGITQPKDRGIILKDIIEHGYATTEKSNTLTKSYGKGGVSDGEKIGTKYERTMIATKPIRIGKLKGSKGSQSTRVYSFEGKAVTLQALAGGSGAKTGLYEIMPDGRLKVLEATKKGYAIAEDGDSVDISFPNSKTRRGRVGKKEKNLMTASSICVFDRGDVRPLTPIECERLQCLPDNYTEGIPKTHRIATCGNAFNVDVIAHILKFIPK